MRNGEYAESRLDCGADGNLADSVANQKFLERSVRLLAEFELVSVTGDVDVFRVELHEWLDLLYEFILSDAVEWRHYFQRRVSRLAVFDYFTDLHIYSNLQQDS